MYLAFYYDNQTVVDFRLEACTEGVDSRFSIFGRFPTPFLSPLFPNHPSQPPTMKILAPANDNSAGAYVLASKFSRLPRPSAPQPRAKPCTQWKKRRHCLSPVLCLLAWSDLPTNTGEILMGCRLRRLCR